jgi:SHS2 domain-containing protein
LPRGYRLVDHTADVGIVVGGRTLGELFEKSGDALFDLLVRRSAVSERESVDFSVRADDLEMLMNEWLSVLLRGFAADGWVFSRVEVLQAGESAVAGRAFGERYDPSRHTIKTEIKAVTFHGLCVRRERGRWAARVIFDV